MIKILSKQSKFKKYEIIALLKDIENKRFIVAYHYSENETTKCFANTPSENIFNYNDNESELNALKQAIMIYENIKS